MKIYQLIHLLTLGFASFAAGISDSTISALAKAERSESTHTKRISNDLNGSNFTYPFPVKLYKFTSQRGQKFEMAYMDIAPKGPVKPNGKTAVLLHGRNFCGPTWIATATTLSTNGYRVVLPDQIGFCKSSKPETYQFSFQQLSNNTLGLLKSLKVDKVTLIGHSMGGMLATRFSLMYPANVTELVLTNPIGMEDWKALGVPYINTDVSYATEHASSYASIKAYEQATYYVNTWNSTYDVWVNMLVNIYKGSKALTYAWNQALVIDMVLTQPVVYEFKNLKVKTLLLIGAKDNTAIGKAWSPPAVQAIIGHYDVLGPQVAAQIRNSTLVVFPDLGHAPHIQAPDRYHDALLGWLRGGGS